MTTPWHFQDIKVLDGSNHMSYSNVIHATFDQPPIPLHSPFPVLSRVDPHQRTRQTWDLPLSRHANPGPVVPAPHAQAVLATAAPNLQQSHPNHPSRQALEPTVEAGTLRLDVLGVEGPGKFSRTRAAMVFKVYHPSVVTRTRAI